MGIFAIKCNEAAPYKISGSAIDHRSKLVQRLIPFCHNFLVCPTNVNDNILTT